MHTDLGPDSESEHSEEVLQPHVERKISLSIYDRTATKDLSYEDNIEKIQRDLHDLRHQEKLMWHQGRYTEAYEVSTIIQNLESFAFGDVDDGDVDDATESSYLPPQLNVDEFCDFLEKELMAGRAARTPVADDLFIDENEGLTGPSLKSQLPCHIRLSTTPLSNPQFERVKLGIPRVSKVNQSFYGWMQKATESQEVPSKLRTNWRKLTKQVKPVDPAEEPIGSAYVREINDRRACRGIHQLYSKQYAAQKARNQASKLKLRPLKSSKKRERTAGEKSGSLPRTVGIGSSGKHSALDKKSQGTQESQGHAASAEAASDVEGYFPSVPCVGTEENELMAEWWMKIRKLSLLGETPLVSAELDKLDQQGLLQGTAAMINKEGNTPLFRAAVEGDDALFVAIVLRLRDDYDKTRVNKHGYNLLHMAVLSNQEAMVATVVRHCVPPLTAFQVSRNGWAPVHLAAAKAKTASLRTLLDPRVWINPPQEGEEVQLALAQAKSGKMGFGDSRSMEEMVGAWSRQLASKATDAGEGKRIVDRLLNLTDRQNRTPVLLAAMYKAAETVLLLVNYGASLRISDKDACTCMHWIARSGISRCVDYLVRRGCYVNGRDLDGWRPLHYAASCCSAATVRALIACGADVDAVDDDGVTPLGRAATAAHMRSEREAVETVEALIEHGAQVSRKFGKGESALHRAAHVNNCDVMLLLHKHGADPNLTDNYGRTPLHWASRYACWNAANLLMKRGALVNTEDNKGRTALHMAAYANRRKYASFLMAEGSEPNYEDCEGWTPLHYAARRGHQEVALLLIARGADPDWKDLNGRTPLHRAVSNDHSLFAQMLLGKKANVNATDSRGRTPLNLATSAGHERCIALLIESGADIEIKDDWGQACLHRAVINNHVHCLSHLVGIGMDVDPRDADGRTPLMWAANNGHFECVQFLLKEGADPTIRAHDQQTCLHRAAVNNHIVIADRLLAAGADPRLQDENGLSAAHVASKEGHEEMAELLRDRDSYRRRRLTGTCRKLSVPQLQAPLDDFGSDSQSLTQRSLSSVSSGSPAAEAPASSIPTTAAIPEHPGSSSSLTAPGDTLSPKSAKPGTQKRRKSRRPGSPDRTASAPADSRFVGVSEADDHEDPAPT
eukprot:Rmarinus@m.23617